MSRHYHRHVVDKNESYSLPHESNVSSSNNTNNNEVLDLFVSKSTNETHNSNTTTKFDQSRLLYDNYEQISNRDIVDRMKDKKFPKKQTVVIEKAESEDDVKYIIQLPKSGLLNRDEFISPIYLPSKCTVNEINAIDNEIGDQTLNNAMVKNLIFCKNKNELMEYKAKNPGKGSKYHFGLNFESNFESGNLYKAESVIRRGAPLGSPEEYDLYIDSDSRILSANYAAPVVNERGCQWFFFRIQNTKKRSYRFNIKNLSSMSPLLQPGMKPSMISENAYGEMKVGWEKVGENIHRQCNTQDTLSSSSSWTYSFEVKFDYPKDSIFIAASPPYTYTQLQNILQQFTEDYWVKKHIRITDLCKTIGDNNFQMIEITMNGDHIKPAEHRDYHARLTNNEPQNNKKSIEDENAVKNLPLFLRKIQKKMDEEMIALEASQNRKPVICCTARIHGGDPISSWMCEGFMKFLVGKSKTAKLLRSHFVFLIFPMMNPDGVINGLNKSDLFHQNLNKSYKTTPDSEKFQPTLYHLNKILSQYKSQGRLLTFIDFHGEFINATNYIRNKTLYYSGGMYLISTIPNTLKHLSQGGHEITKNKSLYKIANPRNLFIAISKRSRLFCVKKCIISIATDQENDTNKNRSLLFDDLMSDFSDDISHKSVVKNKNHEFHFTLRSSIARDYEIPLTFTAYASYFRGRVDAEVLDPNFLTSQDYKRYGSVLCISLADAFDLLGRSVDGVVVGLGNTNISNTKSSSRVKDLFDDNEESLEVINECYNTEGAIAENLIVNNEQQILFGEFNAVTVPTELKPIEENVEQNDTPLLTIVSEAQALEHRFDTEEVSEYQEDNEGLGLSKEAYLATVAKYLRRGDDFDSKSVGTISENKNPVIAVAPEISSSLIVGGVETIAQDVAPEMVIENVDVVKSMIGEVDRTHSAQRKKRQMRSSFLVPIMDINENQNVFPVPLSPISDFDPPNIRNMTPLLQKNAEQIRNDNLGSKKKTNVISSSGLKDISLREEEDEEDLLVVVGNSPRKELESLKSATKYKVQFALPNLATDAVLPNALPGNSITSGKGKTSFTVEVDIAEIDTSTRKKMQLVDDPIDLESVTPFRTKHHSSFDEYILAKLSKRSSSKDFVDNAKQSENLSAATAISNQIPNVEGSLQNAIAVDLNSSLDSVGEPSTERSDHGHTGEQSELRDMMIPMQGNEREDETLHAMIHSSNSLNLQIYLSSTNAEKNQSIQPDSSIVSVETVDNTINLDSFDDNGMKDQSIAIDVTMQQFSSPNKSHHMKPSPQRTTTSPNKDTIIQIPLIRLDATHELEKLEHENEEQRAKILDSITSQYKKTPRKRSTTSPSKGLSINLSTSPMKSSSAGIVENYDQFIHDAGQYEEHQKELLQEIEQLEINYDKFFKSPIESTVRKSPGKLDRSRSPTISPAVQHNPIQKHMIDEFEVKSPKKILNGVNIIELQKSFLTEMGMDYDYLFGNNGIMEKDGGKKSPRSKAFRQHQKALQAKIGGPNSTGEYYNGFPQRKYVNNIQLNESITNRNGGTKGLGQIQTKDDDNLLHKYRHELYYHHIENNLRRRQLTDESSVKLTAQRIYQVISFIKNSKNILNSTATSFENEKRQYHLKKNPYQVIDDTINVHQNRSSSPMKSSSKGRRSSSPTPNTARSRNSSVQSPWVGSRRHTANDLNVDSAGLGLFSNPTLGDDALLDVISSGVNPSTHDHVSTESQHGVIGNTTLPLAESTHSNPVTSRVQISPRKVDLNFEKVSMNVLKKEVGDEKDEVHRVGQMNYKTRNIQLLKQRKNSDQSKGTAMGSKLSVALNQSTATPSHSVSSAEHRDLGNSTESNPSSMLINIPSMVQSLKSFEPKMLFNGQSEVKLIENSYDGNSLHSLDSLSDSLVNNNTSTNNAESAKGKVNGVLTPFRPNHPKPSKNKHRILA